MNTISLSLPFAQIGTGLTQAASGLLASFKEMRKARQTQRYLAQMDDHMLSDIGVSRAQVAFEVERAMRTHRQL